MNKFAEKPSSVRGAASANEQTGKDLSLEIKHFIPELDYILVRKDGRVQSNFRDLDTTSAAILSLKFTPRGELEVSPGRISKNGAFIGEHRIKSGTVFTEGVKISLLRDGPDFVLPGLRTTLASDGIIRTIEDRILALDVGGCYQIGRNVEAQKLDGTISRKHLVVERLPDGEIVKGHSIRKYRLHDGELATENVHYKQGEVWKRLTRAKTLAPGTFLSIGNPDQDPKSLIVEVPEHKELIEKDLCEDPLATRIYTLNPHTNIQLGRRAESDLRTQHTMLVPGIDPVRNKGDIEKVKRAREIGIYVREGLKLLAEKKYDQAKVHFSDVKVLQRCFPDYKISHESNHMHILSSLDSKSVANKITAIACDSWFKTHDGVHFDITPSFGWLREGLVPKNPEEVQNLQRFHREIALIYAEEFIHAFQYASNQLVSRHAIFLNSGDELEHDVAMLFRDYGVPISDLYTERYGRTKALEESEGIQTDKESKLMTDLLAALKPRQSVDLGFLFAKDPQGGLHFELARRAIGLAQPTEKQEDALKHIRYQKRIELIKSRCPDVARILREEDGSYTITPLNGTKLYAPDAYGVWYQANQQSINLASGLFRIGQYIEVELP